MPMIVNNVYPNDILEFNFIYRVYKIIGQQKSPAFSCFNFSLIEIGIGNFEEIAK